jgi:hypothetical protein
MGGGPGRLDGPVGGKGRESISFAFDGVEAIVVCFTSCRPIELSELPAELLSLNSLHTSLIFCPRSKLITPANPPSEPEVGTIIVSCATICSDTGTMLSGLETIIAFLNGTARPPLSVRCQYVARVDFATSAFVSENGLKNAPNFRSILIFWSTSADFELDPSGRFKSEADG